MKDLVVTRYEDMSYDGTITLTLSEDSVTLEFAGGNSVLPSVEFCTPFMGGGQSHNTHALLRAFGDRELWVEDQSLVLQADPCGDRYITVWVNPKLTIPRDKLDLEWALFFECLYLAMEKDNEERPQYR